MAKKPTTKANGNGSAHAETPTDEEQAQFAKTIDLAVETLTGDLRDFLLDRLRYEQDKRPWDKRSEVDQRDTIHRVESAVQDTVRKAVELIAAQGRRTIKATLEQVTVKESIVGKIVLSKFDQQRHALMDSTGATILIVVADPETFSGERSPVDVTPDQGDLEAMVVHSAADGEAEVPFH